MRISEDQNNITMPNGDIIEFVLNDNDNVENWKGCSSCYFRHIDCRSVPCMGKERHDGMYGTFVLNNGDLQNAL